MFHFDENRVSKLNSPRWDDAFAASHLGLFCLPVTHKMTRGLNWLNESDISSTHKK